MSASIHFLHRKSTPVAAYLRVGRNDHRTIEQLIASGKFPYQRVVFDAAHVEGQAELVQTLKKRSVEIVLDLNFAEMSAVGKLHSRSLRKLSWSPPEGLILSESFSRVNSLTAAEKMADFAIKVGADSVLAPCHYIEGINDPWKHKDIDLCNYLRNALDKKGAKDILLAYQVIIDAKILFSQSNRIEFIDSLHSVAVDAIWLRIAGFGAAATGCATRKMIEACRDFHILNQPIIADYASGLATLGAAAFGSIGGISHGLLQRESFRGGHEWRSPPKESSSQGTQKWVFFPDLDRNLNEATAITLLGTKGARSRFCCNDPLCCRNGAESMCGDRHAHFVYQKNKQIENLSTIPENRREEHFFLKHLDPAIRAVRAGEKLLFTDEKVGKSVSKAKSRLERMRDTLSDLHGCDVEPSRSRSPSLRESSFRAAPMQGA